jgi:ribosomal-protein-alanine N-acetyltransferase
MYSLRRLGPEHEQAVLAFEVENRDYFRQLVSDRGDDYFEHYSQRHRALLIEQDAGVCAFHVLVDDDGSVVGRFNLYDLQDGSAELGYRVAEQVSGAGVATAAVRELCRIAADELGLTELTAEVSESNVASRRVLEKSGFELVGRTDVAGRPALAFQRDLA